MLLSIITLNYKKPELTLACLDSLQQQFAEAFTSGNMEVIVVDNDSKDDSVEKMGIAIARKRYRNIRILSSGTNGGFGKGNNFGAARAKGDYIVFLNNDTIVEDDGLFMMAEYMKSHPKVAILGGQLRNSDNSLQASTGKFYTLWYAFLLLLGFQKFGLLDSSPKTISRVDWVKGGLLMIGRKAFEQLKGFDERIFMYTEDMDLCFRAKKKGLAVWFYPDIRVKHAEHGSTNRSFAIINIYKGLLYFYKKHRSGFEYQLVKSLLVAKARVAIGVGKMTGKTELVKTYQEAVKF